MFCKCSRTWNLSALASAATGDDADDSRQLGLLTLSGFAAQQLAVAVHSHMKRVAYEAERRRRRAPSAPPQQQAGPASRQQQQQQQQQQGGPPLSVKEPQEVPVRSHTAARGFQHPSVEFAAKVAHARYSNCAL